MTNRNFVKVLFRKHAIRVRFSGLSLWKLGMILILSSALWALCHKADGGLFDAFSASNAGDAEEMHTYTVADGLVGPVVPIIFQDSRGGLWFGSESGGVSRFDGDTFERFRLTDDLASGITQQILEDRWGRIWFLTRLPAEPEGTLSYFNGTDIEKVEESTATCMTVDRDGDIWAANDRELMHYRGHLHKCFPPRNLIVVKGLKAFPLNRCPTHSRKLLMQGSTSSFKAKTGTFWLGGSAADRILILSFDPSASEFKSMDANITRDNENESVNTAKSASVLLPADGAIHAIAQGPYGVRTPLVRRT